MTRILVVDDTQDNIQLMHHHLTDEHYNVIEATSGKAALQLLQSHHIDLVLLDVIMPEMSGLDVLAKMKADPSLHSIPVILVTAADDDENVALGLDLGALDYIIKPYSSVVMLARVRAVLREKERQDLLEKWATTDPLTSLLNRRHFFELAEREFQRVKRNNAQLSFIMIDIDHFKHVNDTYGHIVGDNTLTTLADLLVKQLRKIDCICRYGGEEFALCLPDTDTQSAFEVAERLRTSTVEQPVTVNSQTQLTIRISLGVASFNRDGRLQDILKRADDALYKAKETGRNRTVCH